MDTVTDTPPDPSKDIKKLSDDFSASLKNITENLSSLNEKVDTQVETLKTVNKKEEKRDYTSELFLDEDQKIEKVVESKLEALRKKDDERGKARRAYDESCAEWDKKAFREIPQLNDPQIEKLVLEEMQSIPILGTDPETKKKLYPADALYNAAYRVRAKNPKLFEQVYEPMDFGNYNKNIKGSTMTEAQKEIAARLNISEDRAREVYKSYYEKKSTRSQRR